MKTEFVEHCKNVVSFFLLHIHSAIVVKVFSFVNTHLKDILRNIFIIYLLETLQRPKYSFSEWCNCMIYCEQNHKALQGLKNIQPKQFLYT